MNKLQTIAASGEFAVIETDADVYVGTIEVEGETVRVFNGFAGRPPVIDFCDILAASFARDHADVVPA